MNNLTLMDLKRGEFIQATEIRNTPGTVECENLRTVVGKFLGFGDSGEMYIETSPQVKEGSRCVFPAVAMWIMARYYNVERVEVEE